MSYFNRVVGAIFGQLYILGAYVIQPVFPTFSEYGQYGTHFKLWRGLRPNINVPEYFINKKYISIN